MTRSILLALTLCMCLGLGAPALAQQGGAQLPVSAPETTVATLAQSWAKLTGQHLLLDPQVANLRIKVQPGVAWWNLSEAREALRFHDVIVVARGQALQFVHCRQLPTKSAPPYPVYEPDDLLPEDEMLTVIVTIRHGAASSIFANLRGILARDSTRAGNILLVTEKAQLVITDLGAKVRYYLDLIERLDVAPTRVRAAFEVFELPSARLGELSRGSLAEVGSRLALAARQDEGVTRVSRARVGLHDELELTRQLGELSFQVTCRGGKVGLTLTRPKLADRPQALETVREPLTTLRCLFLASDPVQGRVRVAVLRREGSAAR